MQNTRNLLLLLAFVLGLSLGDFAAYTKSTLLPVLIILMTVSFAGIASREFFPLKSLFKTVFVSCLLNYFLFGALLLLWYAMFSIDRSYWPGFVVIVTTPPGVAIIPFTFILKGDVRFATVGTVGAYLFALFVSPIALKLLIGSTNISVHMQLLYMLRVIVLPFVISRLLRRDSLYSFVERSRSTIVNLSFFIVFYTIIGMNRATFFSNPQLILKLVMIAVLTYVIPGEVLHRVLTARNVPYEETIVARMMSGIKNGGLIAVTAFNLFGAEAAVPGTVISSVAIVYLLSLTIRYGTEH